MKRYRHSPGSKSAGFALLEILLSITLAVMMIAFITGGFKFGVRAWETDQRTEAIHDAVIANRAIGTWIAGAMPLSKSADAGRFEIAFDGTADDISFVTLSDGRTQRAGLLSMRLSMVPNATGATSDIVVETAIFRRDSVSPVTSVALIQNASLEFAYFGRATNGDGLAWRQTWRHLSTLPRLISFRIVSAGSTAMSATIVRLRNGDAVLAKAAI